MKTKWLVIYVTAVESPHRAEHAILDFGGGLAGHFWLILAILVDEEPLCDLGTPS